MQMVRMVVTAEHQYAGRRLHAGQEYDCEPQHVALMQQHGWARRKDEAAAPSQQYQTRDMAAKRPRSRGIFK
jgi:hypothetical protein